MELPPDPPGDFGFFTEGASQALNPQKRAFDAVRDAMAILEEMRHKPMRPQKRMKTDPAQEPDAVRAVEEQWGLREKQTGPLSAFPSLLYLSYQALPTHLESVDGLEAVLDRADAARPNFPGFIEYPDHGYTTNWDQPWGRQTGYSVIDGSTYTYLGQAPSGEAHVVPHTSPSYPLNDYPDGGLQELFPEWGPFYVGTRRFGGFFDNPYKHSRKGGND